MFGYENKLAFPIYFSDQKFKDSIDLSLLIDNDNLHYVYIKDLTDICLSKQKIKTRNGFVRVVYIVLVAKVC